MNSTIRRAKRAAFRSHDWIVLDLYLFFVLKNVSFVFVSYFLGFAVPVPSLGPGTS